MKEIDLVVLKYSLCICWIELASYEAIVKAVECLKDIQDNHVSKFPAVYYGLGNAYYKLNRYTLIPVPLRGFDCMQKHLNDN
jgi:hypothetical protein